MRILPQDFERAHVSDIDSAPLGLHYGSVQEVKGNVTGVPGKIRFVVE